MILPRAVRGACRFYSRQAVVFLIPHVLKVHDRFSTRLSSSSNSEQSNVMAVRLDEPPDRALVLRKHTYWDKSLGKDFRLGLVEDVSLPLRVYVLECRTSRGALCQYVGIVHVSELRQRWERHWAGKVHYTSVYPPQRVLLLWPASTEAAEAFVYNERLRGMGANHEASKIQQQDKCVIVFETK